MIRKVNFTSRFEKDLERLRNCGERAVTAAARIDSIVADLVARGGTAMDHRCDVHRYVENRIENGVKFDIGGGYRLIVVHEGLRLFLVFAGYHDASDRWIMANRIRQVKWQDTVTRSLDVATTADKIPAPGVELKAGPDESDWGKPIDDKVLRQVFSGLCGHAT